MKKHMISVQTARWYQEDKQWESMKLIKECGFEAIDYNISNLFTATFDEENYTSFFDKSLAELYDYYKPMKEAAKEYGISFAQSHGIGTVYFEGQDFKNEYIMQVTEKMIAVCAYLECPMIVIHPWTGWLFRMENEHEVNMHIYRRLIPTARRYGVKICLENYPHSDVHEVCQYIDSLNAEAQENIFGYCLDIGHARMGKNDINRMIKVLGNRIIALHLHENNGTVDSHLIPFTQVNEKGDGRSIDWNLVLDGLREIGYEGALSFETFNALKILPEKLKKAALSYICEIGRYFREYMAAEREEMI